MSRVTITAKDAGERLPVRCRACGTHTEPVDLYGIGDQGATVSELERVESWLCRFCFTLGRSTTAAEREALRDAERRGPS